MTATNPSTAGSKTKKGTKVPTEPIDGTSTGLMAQADKEREKESEQQGETPILSRSAELFAAIKDGDTDLDTIAKKRTELTDEKKLIYARFDVYGLNKKGVDDARAQIAMTEEQFRNYDLTVLMVREALGKPIKAQDDLFEAAARREIKEHAEGKKRVN